MVLKYYGKSAGIGPLKTAAGTRIYEGPNATGQKIKVGLTLPSGIQDALAKYGLLATVQRGTIDDVISLIDKNRPPILLVRSGGETWHYVVAIGHRQRFTGKQLPNNLRESILEIRLANPSGSKEWIAASTLDGSWQYSNDLDGQATEGRRCRTCGGSGSIAAGPLKTKCPLCGGSKRESDYFRKIVESAGASGHTLISVRAGAGTPSSTGGTASSIAKIKYTLWNDSGRTVKFRLPTGKTYSLDPGQKGSYQNTDSPEKLKIYVFSTDKTYRLEDGNHKFWWKKDEGRVAFDLHYDR